MINLINFGIKTRLYIIIKYELKPKKKKEKRRRKNILPQSYLKSLQFVKMFTREYVKRKN